jgi:AAA domain
VQDAFPQAFLTLERLRDLTTYAKSRGTVVRLLGDDRQLPAVDSGGALRLLAREPGTPQLTTLYRFRDPDEAAATLKLRVGDATAVDWYHARDRIRSGSRQAMTQAAYVADHVQLLYATTSQRSQGATVDTAHPLVTRGMSCESLYVLASRARERTPPSMKPPPWPCSCPGTSMPTASTP